MSVETLDASPMTQAKLPVSKAARMAGVDRTTLYRQIKEGKLSKAPGGGIMLTELLRVYPHLNDDPDDAPPAFADADTPEARRAALCHSVESGRELVDDLRGRVEHLTKLNNSLAEQVERKDRLIERVVTSRSDKEDKLMQVLTDMSQRLLPPPEAESNKPRWWHLKLR